VAKLTLDSRYTRPGDTVRGHVDFSRAQIRCYRLAITLEQTEIVQEDVMKPGLVAVKAAASASSSSAASSPSSSAAAAVASRRVFWHFHQYTVNTFCLPLDVVANFRTDLVEVSWGLKFAFITDVSPQPNKAAWTFLPAPSSTKAEPLRWTLPLNVLPHDKQETLRQSVLKTILCTPQACT
jgi:hypothetical protein